MKNFLLSLALLLALPARADGPIQNAQVSGVVDVEKSILTTTGNLTASNHCIASPGTTVGLFVGAYIYDNTNPTYIPALTTVAGLPGSCSAGQIQMSANASNPATGDTLYFGGNPLTQVVSDQKIMVTANSINQTLNASIVAGLIGGGGSGGGIQMSVLNGNAEIGTTASWSPDVGGDFSNSNSSPLNGTWSFVFLPVSPSEKVVHALIPVPLGLQGQNCVANMAYSTTESTQKYVFTVKDGAGNVLNSEMLSASGGASSFAPPLSFLCPATTVQLVVSASSGGAPSASIKLDEFTVGQAVSTQISQAKMLGSVVVTGCAGAWSSTATSLSAFTPQSGCSYALSGSAIAPATNVPGLKFASIPSGELVLQYEGYVEQGTAGVQGYFQFTDGTNFSREQSTVGGSASSILTPGISQSIHYSTAQSNVTLQIYGQTNASGSIVVGNTPAVIRVYFFPDGYSIAPSVDQIPASWSGYQQNSTGWTRTTTSMGDFSTGSASIFTTTSRNLTCVNEATGLPAITCTPAVSGVYHITAIPNFSQTGSQSPQFRLVDGSNNIIDPGRRHDASSQTFGETLQGDYTVLTAGTPVTFKVQGFPNGGTFSIGFAGTGAAIQWQVSDADFNSAVPYTMGSVTSSAAGVERLERVVFDGGNVSSACTSSPCHIESSSPGVTSVTRSSAGVYIVNFSAGTFSAAPTCMMTPDFGTSFSIRTWLFSSWTSTAVEFVMTNFASPSTGADGVASIMCQGPH